MNIKAITLTIISVAATVAVSQPVQAQEAEPRHSSARWDFAPNVWRKEEISKPRGYNQPNAVAVRSGAVPSRNVLGLDPGYLAKAAPPPLPKAQPLINIQQAVAAVPIAKPKQNPLEAFKSAFGQPISAAPPQMMAALPQSLPASPMALPAAHRPVAARPIHHAASLNGKLLTPQHHVGLAAKPAAPIANYGNMGFQPGAFAPVASNGGMNTRTAVAGKIISR